MQATTSLSFTAALAIATFACNVPSQPTRLDEAYPRDAGSTNVPSDPVADWELPSGAFDRAERLFAEQCAVCHGDRGRGDGPASAMLLPPPRDFGEGRFQLVSTHNGFPSELDLRGTLERGMPGSAMPPYDWMPEEDLDVLVGYVRKLAIESAIDRLVADGMSESEALDQARTRMSPGERIDVGALPAQPPTTATLERGRAIYMTTCAPCHGDDGRGRREEPRWNERGDIEWARDFTRGILKGGTSHADLVYRIESGMPGSSMPATHFEDPAERNALVAYVQSLLPEGAGERMVRKRSALRVARVDELPRAADELRWSRAQPLDVVLAPNSWRDDSILNATVQGLHDGERIALRVSWRDANRNDRPFGEFAYPDQVALMLSPAGTPPPYGMGSPEHPVDLWRWSAFRLEDVAGALDLIDDEVHQRADVMESASVADVPGYVPARDAPEQARILRAHGMDERREGAAIEADARWAGDGWAVVFTRELAAGGEAGVALPAGGQAQLSVAVWNGAAHERGSQKSLSIWQELQLER